MATEHPSDLPLASPPVATKLLSTVFFDKIRDSFGIEPQNGPSVEPPSTADPSTLRYQDFRAHKVLDEAASAAKYHVDDDETETGDRDAEFIRQWTEPDPKLVWSKDLARLRQLKAQGKLPTDRESLLAAFKHLKFINKDVTEIDAEARKMTRLTDLSLSVNFITTVQNLPKSLQSANLHANRIRDLSTSSFPEKLMLLGVGYNLISELKLPAGALQSLLSLDISHNRLWNLPATLSAVAALPNIRHLTLTGNPFCALHKYRATVVQTLPRLVVLDEVQIRPEERQPADELSNQQQQQQQQQSGSVGGTPLAVSSAAVPQPFAAAIGAGPQPDAYLALTFDFVRGKKSNDEDSLFPPASVPALARAFHIEAKLLDGQVHRSTYFPWTLPWNVEFTKEINFPVTEDLSAQLKAVEATIVETRFKKALQLSDLKKIPPRAAPVAAPPATAAAPAAAPPANAKGAAAAKAAAPAAPSKKAPPPEPVVKYLQNPVAQKVHEEIKAHIGSENMPDATKVVAKATLDLSSLLDGGSNLEADFEIAKLKGCEESFLPPAPPPDPPAKGAPPAPPAVVPVAVQSTPAWLKIKATTVP